MKDLNKIRLMAGIAIDGNIEITEKTEVVSLSEGKDTYLNDFWVVVTPTAASAKVDDIVIRTNTQGLFNLAKGKDVSNWLVYGGESKHTAVKDAKKRLSVLRKQRADEEAALEASEVLQEVGDDKLAKKDFDGDGKIESPSDEYKGSRDKAIKKAIKKAKEKKAGEIEESMHTFKKDNYGSFEDDEHDPVNVVTKKGETNSHDRPEMDKDESPRQLDNPGEASEQSTVLGDHETKVVVPAKLIKQLKDQADEARAEAKRLDVSNTNSRDFYNDLASAFDDLRMHLEGGTIYSLKQAQVFMTSLMGPMLHKIPADVVRYIAYAGKPRSLKSYMSKVTDYPITGPRNTLR